MSDPREAALAQKAMARESELAQCRRELAQVKAELAAQAQVLVRTAEAGISASADLKAAEAERDELAKRLEHVLAAIDKTPLGGTLMVMNARAFLLSIKERVVGE